MNVGEITSGVNVSDNKPWSTFWPEGVPQSVDYPDIPLHEFVTNSARAHPHRPALMYEGGPITYRELDLSSKRVACALQNLGIVKGDRVMVILPNIPEFVISYLGILKAGAIMTAAGPLCKEKELKRHIADADPKAIVCENGHVDLILSNTSKKILISVGKEKHAGVHDFHELIENRNSRKFRKCEIHPENDIAVLQYTGGTTGLPKGAMMTHSNLVANAIQNALWFNWSKNDVVLGVLSLCHTWGLCTCINSSMYVGASVVLIPRFDPGKVLSSIESRGVTIAYGSASMFTMLLNSPEIGKHNLTSLRLTKAGAMPIPPEMKRRWDELGPCELVLGYGLTEASPETHNSPPERIKAGTIGIPIIDTDAKIVDTDTGTRELGPNKVGELAVRGPQVMKGYWNNAQETKRVLRDEWLFTGDIGKMDEEGYFYIIDRKKDLIKYKGYSLFPAELENLLYEHPMVKECAVVGQPSPEVGEIPTAYVVLKEGSRVTEEELKDFSEKRIAPYKKIREIEFVSEIPKTVVGKTLRRELRKT